MAIYVPDQLRSNIQSLNSVANQWEKSKANDRQAAMQQIAALQKTGGNAQDMAGALDVLKYGGKGLNYLFRQQPEQNMDVTSPFYNDAMTQERKFAADPSKVNQIKELAGQKTQTDVKRAEENLTRKDEDALLAAMNSEDKKSPMKDAITQDMQQMQADTEQWRRLKEQYTDPVTGAVKPGMEENLQYLENKIAMAQNRIQENQSLADKELGSSIQGELGKEFDTEYKAGIDKFDEAKKTIKYSTYWSADAKKKILSGDYRFKDTDGKWKPLADISDPDKIESLVSAPTKEIKKIEEGMKKDEANFIAKEKERIKEYKKEAGPYTGDETSMRAKNLKLYQQEMRRANGNPDAMREVYEKYTTGQKNIDARYGKKTRYNPFEQEFRTLFLGKKGGTGGGGRFETVHVFDPKTAQVIIKRINASSEADAVKKLKAMGVEADASDLYFTKFGSKTDGNWLKGRYDKYKIDFGKRQELLKSASNLNQRIGIGVDDKTLESIADASGVRDKTRIMKLKDSGYFTKIVDKLTPDQRIKYIKYLDSAGGDVLKLVQKHNANKDLLLSAIDEKRSEAKNIVNKPSGRKNVLINKIDKNF